MGKRYYGLDITKGIAVLGMLLSHSFMGTLARWEPAILFDLVSKLPLALTLFLMGPICLFSQMGSLFSFISAIVVTLSFLNVYKKGFGVVWRYIVLKMVFAFLLRGMEIFWNQWTVNWDWFETRRMQWPIVEIPFVGHTLDMIGLLGWFIPLCVYVLRIIPFLMDYRIQVSILYVISIVITIFSHDISKSAENVVEYCSTNSLHFIAYLFSKISSGPFQLPQVLPFGLFGAAIAIILHSTSTMKPLWWFFLITTIINCIVGGLLLTRVDDFLTELFGSFKPEGFMTIIMSVQFLMIIICILILDNPQRAVIKRQTSLKRTVLLRRINTLSLTAYVMEPFLSKQVFIIFQIPMLFGKAVDYDNKVCLWYWPIVALYAFVVVIIAILIARLWEVGDFRFSIEYQLNAIMLWLFNQGYSKTDYKAHIYGPINEIQEEVDASYGPRGVRGEEMVQM